MKANCKSLVLPALLISLAACTSTASIAKRQFSTDYTCPEDRIAVQKRSSGPLLPPQSLRPPPAEVANDPERVRLWYENQRRMQEQLAKAARTYLFDISGCGHQDIYQCMEYQDVDNGGEAVNYVNCNSTSAPNSLSNTVDALRTLEPLVTSPRSP